MSKHRVLSFKPYLRLERRGQDGQSETEQPDHSASLGDSITSSTRISFRYTQALIAVVPTIPSIELTPEGPSLLFGSPIVRISWLMPLAIPAYRHEAAAVSLTGDFWKLGRHRLICGEARDKDAYTLRSRVISLRRAAVLDRTACDAALSARRWCIFRNANQKGPLFHPDCDRYCESPLKKSGSEPHIRSGAKFHELIRRCDVTPRKPRRRQHA